MSRQAIGSIDRRSVPAGMIARHPNPPREHHHTSRTDRKLTLRYNRAFARARAATTAVGEISAPITLSRAPTQKSHVASPASDVEHAHAEADSGVSEQLSGDRVHNVSLHAKAIKLFIRVTERIGRALSPPRLLTVLFLIAYIEWLSLGLVRLLR